MKELFIYIGWRNTLVAIDVEMRNVKADSKENFLILDVLVVALQYSKGSS